jgi:hypothetical protein
MNILARYQLFLDLDGVLADFDAGVREITGKLPAELEPKRMWPRLASTPDFYDSLGWMDDGRKLWDFCAAFDPVILTGLPMGAWAEPQKRRWCARELGDRVPVITCMSRDKAKKAGEYLLNRGDADSSTPIPVLVDDRLRLQEAWETMGGVFIHHRNADESIRELRALGFAGSE